MTYTVLNRTIRDRGFAAWWRRWSPAPQIALVGLIAAVIPLLLTEQSLYMKILLAAIVVTGLGLFMGYAGQAALGQGAFVATGALTVAVFSAQWGLPSWLGLVAAPVISGLCAALIGWPLLRLRGHYLAFGTLAVLLLVQLAMQSIPLFGAGQGVVAEPLIDRPDGIRARAWNPILNLVYVYLAVAVLIIVLIMAHRVIASRYGRGIRALAGSESAAASSGVPILGSKLKVFVIAAVFAGAAGGITALWYPYVNQEAFPIADSFGYVIMAVVGGMTSLWGGVVGAAIIVLLLELLNRIATLPGVPEVLAHTMQYAGYGLVLVLVLLFMPKGLMPALAAATQRRRGRGSGHGSGP